MLRYIFILIFTIRVFALSVSSDDDYKIYHSKFYNIIYTKEYKNEAKYIKQNLDNFLKLNNKSFGYKFDEPLRIVLISNNIQLPNAFSTQVPFNLGIYFNGGGGMNGYFASKSWLTTLLVHEMMHNYQTNAKKSKISQTLHKYLGNNFAPVIVGLPFFTLPNLLLPTALIEGNSVLNESIYQNGGRLYNGSLNSLKNILIFSNKIDTNSFINDNLTFPYTTQKYIVGGYYMLYMAQLYGIDKVNQFFYTHSIHSINPLLLNNTYKKYFGISFEQSIQNFINYTKQKYKNFKPLKPQHPIATSKSDIKLNKIDDKIYFITTNLTTSKVLNIFDIKNTTTKKSDTTLSATKVFKLNHKLYSSKSDFISSTKLKYGLFDKNNYILKTTVGKDIQDIQNNHIAYIDIEKSFLKTQLYIDDKFYTDIASNAIFDTKNNIYYFKQQKNKRVLYKNKQKLYEFDGYFSILADIYDDSIYFIANSKNGSSLYKYTKNTLYRVSSYDNIVDAKIITPSKALVTTINKDSYQVSMIDLTPTKEKIYFPNIMQREFVFENSDDKKLISSKYNEIKELQFSMLYPTYTSDTTKGSTFTLDAIFLDPIMFNMLDIYNYKIYEDRLTGINYTNERYIPFTLDIHNVKHNDIDQSYTAGSIKIYGPLVKKGDNLLEVELKHYIDDDNREKKPTIVDMQYSFLRQFPLATSENLIHKTNLTIKSDRDTKVYQLKYYINKHIISQFYINAMINYEKSNIVDNTTQKGIEVVTTPLDMLQDKTNTLMEGADDNFFVKKLIKSSIGFSKTFYFNRYFSTFPISIRKELLFYNYNHYNLTTTDTDTINETISGITFDLLLAHKLSLPLTIKYITNDLSIDNYKIIVSVGTSF